MKSNQGSNSNNRDNKAKNIIKKSSTPNYGSSNIKNVKNHFENQTKEVNVRSNYTKANTVKTDLHVNIIKQNYLSNSSNQNTNSNVPIANNVYNNYNNVIMSSRINNANNKFLNINPLLNSYNPKPTTKHSNNYIKIEDKLCYTTENTVGTQNSNSTSKKVSTSYIKQNQKTNQNNNNYYNSNSRNNNFKIIGVRNNNELKNDFIIDKKPKNSIVSNRSKSSKTSKPTENSTKHIFSKEIIKKYKSDKERPFSVRQTADINQRKLSYPYGKSINKPSYNIKSDRSDSKSAKTKSIVTNSTKANNIKTTSKSSKSIKVTKVVSDKGLNFSENKSNNNKKFKILNVGKLLYLLNYLLLINIFTKLLT